MATKTYKRGWGVTYNANIIRNIDNFPYWLLSSTQCLNDRKWKGGRKVVNTVSAFDIETSNTMVDGEQHSFMYIWQWKLLDWVIVGREWWEFKLCLQRVQDVIREKKLIVFVHNLGYEFQFLKGVIDFTELDDQGKRQVFANSNRRPLYARVGSVEFRCSYQQTGVSLAKLCVDYNTVDKKLSGDEFDYDVLRTATTRLSERELQYCIVDVLCLCQAMEQRMKDAGDTLITLPLTSTGYVRRDVKKLTTKTWKQANSPDYETFCKLVNAFRGGDTHANRYNAGYVLDNVISIDRSSSYPAEMVNKEYPLGEWHVVEGANEAVLGALKKQHKAFVAELKLTGVRLEDIYNGMPCLAKAKCLYIKKKVIEVNEKTGKVKTDFDADFDNGRILWAAEITLGITDVDWEIIRKEYVWDELEVLDCRICEYHKLPTKVINYIIEKYKGKTELKGVEGREADYMLDKAKINSVYGMSVQNPAKQEIIYDFEGNWVLHQDKTDEELYNENVTKFALPYSVGVWVTAYARLELRKCMWAVGRDNVVYCDTDSVKFLTHGGVDEHVMDDYNLNQRALAAGIGSVATDRKGKNHYLGEYEYEHCYPHFATLGAKKYCYYEEDMSFHITIAGVGKKEGAIELEEAAKKRGLRAIDLFVDRRGFVFKTAGGKESRYHDHIKFEHTLENGEVVEITDNVSLVDSTYSLNVNDEYDKVLVNAIALRQALAYHPAYANCI